VPIKEIEMVRMKITGRRDWKERMEIDNLKNTLAISSGYRIIRIWSDEIDLKWRVMS